MLRRAPAIGRYVFGAATVAFGLVTLTWHEYDGLRLARDVWNGPGASLFTYAVAAAQTFGGAAMLVRRFARIGSAAAGAAYLVFALVRFAKIIAEPRIYDTWGNFFEQFSLVLGAAFVYATVASLRDPASAIRLGAVSFGACAMSFAVEQAIHPNATAGLVPAWLPPNRTFWTNATTAAFVLAALALVTHRAALLAARLMTAMLVGFGVVVWLPILSLNARDPGDWGETIETFAIAGASWLLAVLLGASRNRRP